MKKCILAVLSVILLYNLVQAADFFEDINFDKESIKQIVNQDLKDLPSVLEREIITEKTPFINDRVKQMCSQWPTCTEWAENKFLKDPAFKVIDAEVERWISKWEGKKAVWEYKFYVQTKEEGGTNAYLFTRGVDGFPYNEPVLIKKFPGHPVLGKPSEHMTYLDTSCKSWPGCSQWKYSSQVYSLANSQHIYKYDNQGNALWERRLYVSLLRFLHSNKYFYFRAYQTKAGGAYNYEAPVEINAFPSPKF